MNEMPVIIAGGGPVGQTLAIDLARRGIRTLIVERNESTTKHPKMDITNSRSMELFRSLGIVQALRDAAVPTSSPFDVSWITDFTGEELHRFRYLSVDDMHKKIREKNDGTLPLEPPMRVSQVVIEPVLRAVLEKQPLVDFRFSTKFESFKETADGVTVVLKNMVTGKDETWTCKYLVGCDGGASEVRQQLNINLSGKARIMERFMTHFRSTETSLLQRWGIAWHYQSGFGTLIAQNDKDIWTLHSRTQTGDAPGEDSKALIRQFVGRDIEAEILVANKWTPHLLVADSYSTRRVFLAGDSAHQYIPTGGYGMNTGIGDATNLSWKLAAVLKGYAGEALLESYDIERRPIGNRNCDAAERNNDVRREIGGLYTPGLYARGAEGDAVRKKAAAEIARLGNLENEAWGIEHGYVYANSPAVVAELGAEFSTDPAVYIPTTVPGARLPSTFLPDGSAMYDNLGQWLTVICLKNMDSAQNFERAASARGIPLKVINATAAGLSSVYQASLLLVRPDHHVAWRGSKIESEIAAGTLLDHILGRTVSAEKRVYALGR